MPFPSSFGVKVSYLKNDNDGMVIFIIGNI
jgi:hypothetical protein